MPKFVLAYHGANNEMTPEEGQAHMAAWMAWQDGLGDALGSSMPVGKSKTISKDGVADDGGSNPLSGVTILEAADMDTALELAKGCPHVNIGTIEIAQAMEM